MKINSLKFNNSTIHKMYHGNELVNKIGDAFTYMEASGDTPTPPTPVPYDEQYLTIESLEDNNTITWKASGNDIVKTISASTDNGSTWTEYTSSFYGTTIATLNTGDKVLVKGTNETYTISTNSNNRFLSNENFIVYGNIMSLISGDSFVNADTLTANYTFAVLFREATGLTSAENLIMPATTLTENCYEYMFRGCTNLTTAPALPATTLAIWCYSQMFYGCTSLTTAPVLPARILINGCYQNMFRNCTSLNYIKCLATMLAANNCTSNWVNNVAASGTFVKAPSMTSWSGGNNGIPNGWTVQNAN